MSQFENEMFDRMFEAWHLLALKKISEEFGISMKEAERRTMGGTVEAEQDPVYIVYTEVIRLLVEQTRHA